MRLVRCTSVLLGALGAMACTIVPASAFGAGGTAPGGPLSGSIRPACNGYNMDGTINLSPGAKQPGCIDQSARSLGRGPPRSARLACIEGEELAPPDRLALDRDVSSARYRIVPTLYDFAARRLDGAQEKLDRYHGEVLLIVNTASKCGFTPQYEGLEELQRAYAPRGFNVLGFPCNQFGNQEPGDAAAIGQFCTANYGVSFPMFAKVEVNGAGAHPLFQYLKMEKPGLLGLQGIKWNFTKFLIDRAGVVTERFGPMTKPQSIKGQIEKLL